MYLCFVSVCVIEWYHYVSWWTSHTWSYQVSPHYSKTQDFIFSHNRAACFNFSLYVFKCLGLFAFNGSNLFCGYEFFLGGWSTSSRVQGILLLCAQETYDVLEIKLGSASCNVSTLTPVLALWPKGSNFLTCLSFRFDHIKERVQMWTFVWITGIKRLELMSELLKCLLM